MDKPTTAEQARLWGNTGRMTPDRSVAAIRDLRGDTVISGQHPRVILSECKAIERRKR